MPRQINDEIHVGQKVLVRFDPQSHPIEALVTYLDVMKGLVHVNPIGYKVRWAARPPAISNMHGLYLHFKNDCFFFSPDPFLP